MSMESICIALFWNELNIWTYSSILSHGFDITAKQRMRGPRKSCKGGSNSDNDVLIDEGNDDPNTTKRLSSSARQQNAI